ncbi:MAG TPA: hypothetical protein VGE16_13545, partial [Albitalea sp.]
DAEPAVPMLLRPLPPRALVAAEAPVPSPRHRTSSPADERRPAPASPRAGHLPPAPQRIVQTTVVVAAPESRRLDELAHSSAISRFGIGQG